MSTVHPAFDGFPQNISYNGQRLKGGLLQEDNDRMIMGTFPPPDSIARIRAGCPFFYYNSYKSHFWNRIESFVPLQNNLRWKWLTKNAETEIQNVQRKIKLSFEKHWAFMDFFSEIDRRHENAEDANLINLSDVVRNGQLFTALMALEKLSVIYCTYLLAFDSLNSALSAAGYPLTTAPEPLAANAIKKIWQFNDREITNILLYPASRSGNAAALKDTQYKNYLN